MSGLYNHSKIIRHQPTSIMFLKNFNNKISKSSVNDIYLFNLHDLNLKKKFSSNFIEVEATSVFPPP